MEAAEILVIINSAVLVLFLIIGLIVLVQILLLIKHIRHLIEKAEDVADKVEGVSGAIRQAALQVSLGRMVRSIFKSFPTSQKASKK